MSQFKSGDLALTLAYGIEWPPMTQVTLDVFLPKGTIGEEPDGGLFTAPFDGLAVYREDEDGAEFFRAEHLMPLRGNFQPEQQKSLEVVE